MAKQPKLGSGGRFRALSAQLAARGAHDPDALAAWIGRRKYGAKKMGRLSHMSNTGLLDILLADSDSGMSTCPRCGYSGDNAEFKVNQSGGASGTQLQTQPGDLLTPARGNLGSAGMNATQGVGVASTGSVKGALSNTGYRSIGLAEPLAPRLAITGPYDYMVNRSSEDPSVALVRHRRGGDLIGQVRKTEDGWQGVLGDSIELQPHTQQRAALLELLSVHNRSVVGNNRPMPFQAAPQQTPLMARYGIPAIRALAMPATGAMNGPRVTTSAASGGGGDGGTDSNGLTPRGQAIYKKLIAKGFPAARALSFAKNSQNMSAGSFKKAS